MPGCVHSLCDAFLHHLNAGRDCWMVTCSRLLSSFVVALFLVCDRMSGTLVYTICATLSSTNHALSGACPITYRRWLLSSIAAFYLVCDRTSCAPAYTICATLSSTTLVLGGAHRGKRGLRQKCNRHTRAICVLRNTAAPKDILVIDGLGSRICNKLCFFFLSLQREFNVRRLMVLQYMLEFIHQKFALLNLKWTRTVN